MNWGLSGENWGTNRLEGPQFSPVPQFPSPSIGLGTGTGEKRPPVFELYSGNKSAGYPVSLQTLRPL
jgi:hypothetical protein